MVTNTAYGSTALWFRYFITQLGANLPFAILSKLDGILNYLTIGYWLKTHGFAPERWARSRWDLFKQLVEMRQLESKQVVYLEFGVYKGESIRDWASLLKNPQSELVGFDTFYGLPESWTAFIPEGTFSTDGRLPNVDDSRIRFVVGRFRESLATFQVPKTQNLIINVDSDLYSAAWEVFDAMKSHLKPGTIIYFDEICDRHNEMRAFQEFIEKTNTKFKLLIADRTCAHAAFEILA